MSVDSMAVSENRLVHLDLKGCPLKLGYLEQLFPLLSQWGATGLLLEWEDTFPYSGRLAGIGSLASPNPVYSEDDVKQILALAVDSNLTVMPLVQTFGHLEFVLKCREWRELREVPQYPSSLCPAHPLSLPLVCDMLDQFVLKCREWRELREVPQYPSSLCPAHPLSLPLVCDMLDQVLHLTPATKYIHIGADEVWHIGRCTKCVAKSKSGVFLSHIVAVLKHLHENHPHVQPVMWDDMLRTTNQSDLQDLKIGELVEPMVWHYQASHTFLLSEEMWQKYSQVFPRVWLASAFKGATGSCQLLPVPLHHVSNHQQWLTIKDRIIDKFKHIRGIALTGWSRYDHFATLCELLPPSLPSLALCLQVWLSRDFSDQLLRSVSRQLGYSESPLPLNPYPRPQTIPHELTFPGWRVAVGVEWLANLRTKQASVLDSDQVQTWLNVWQIKNNFTNPMQIEPLHNTLRELDEEWESLERYLCQHLPEVYYERTIAEWVGTLITPCVLRIRKTLDSATSQLQLNS